MGGKSYYCDYCACFIKNDVNVRKTHNSGLMHNIAKANYMRRYEADPRKILNEESVKVPCTRFPKGACKFGFYCQYSHYGASQLNELREIVKKLDERLHKNKNAGNQMEPFLKIKNKRRMRRKLNYQNLPPSLRKSNRKFIKLKNFTLEWG